MPEKYSQFDIDLGQFNTASSENMGAIGAIAGSAVMVSGGLKVLDDVYRNADNSEEDKRTQAAAVEKAVIGTMALKSLGLKQTLSPEREVTLAPPSAAYEVWGKLLKKVGMQRVPEEATTQYITPSVKNSTNKEKGR